MLSTILSAAALASAPVPAASETTLPDRNAPAVMDSTQEKLLVCVKQAVDQVAGQAGTADNFYGEVLYRAITPTDNGPIRTTAHFDPVLNNVAILNSFTQVTEAGSYEQLTGAIMNISTDPDAGSMMLPKARSNEAEIEMAHTLIARQQAAMASYRNCALNLK